MREMFLYFHFEKYEDYMNFTRKPPELMFRRLILKKVYDTIKKVICKQQY